MTPGATILTIFLKINLPNFVQADRYDTSRKGTDGMIFTSPGKCRYGIPSHTVPLRAETICPLPVPASSGHAVKCAVVTFSTHALSH